MAKAKRKPRTQQRLVQAAIDATPERLAKGDLSEFINPAEIDDTEQRIGRVRRFRASMLDRLYHNGKLTWGQFHAGDQFRNAYHRAGFALSVVANYGERTSAGEISYGLPRTERQVAARQLYRSLLSEVEPHMQGFMLRFLIRDALPRYGGRKAMRASSDIRKSLDRMAMYLNLPT
jgi:hypothetical protein